MSVINDDVSKKLGTYMLQGYTLLDAVCPQCEKVPMMRLRDQPMFCVACIEKPKLEQSKKELPKAEVSTSLSSSPSLPEAFSQKGDAVRQQPPSSQTKSEPHKTSRNRSSQQEQESVYVKLIDELEAQLEDFLPIPHSECREAAFQRIERILRLIELAKDLKGKN
ncbi:Sjogren's syndrome/scleroderma autoantigen 1 family protein [Schizosaccharomyces cryophilus OY26]|uniref:Sjogren's syndrome/scleroderma autoantigen 1 family protein n=1 Tax=Schizosaccharomyces cryophilus (strain OY26 / ATCC MYA-4695 / CBS 11777 / NBRC 106824 / NRRL Y48691) TaxID=653667 RepID=S9X9M0_SCHCR|nr:Sjogren's syndrome/scleroderma autoantigen 1 family protein [Schizosaccharomyces cryophilus OY26]EPY50451.1 Sjogren's syndrome/scleroderma autoantigen 1 family protein [Schizosaccharomyces cryophilus OY26]